MDPMVKSLNWWDDVTRIERMPRCHYDINILTALSLRSLILPHSGFVNSPHVTAKTPGYSVNGWQRETRDDFKDAERKRNSCVNVTFWRKHRVITWYLPLCCIELLFPIVLAKRMILEAPLFHLCKHIIHFSEYQLMTSEQTIVCK